jgi:hypothetical protein
MKNLEKSINKFQNITNYRQTMKKNEELQNEIHFAISRNPFNKMAQTSISAKVGRYMKIFSYLVLLTGIGIVFTSCMGGYVASEPMYMDYARPQRQYDNQIWISGDWGWNNQTHVYVQKAGYWDRPRQGQSYIEGRWTTSPRGKSWTKGHWQKDSKQNNNQRKNNGRGNNK